MIEFLKCNHCGQIIKKVVADNELNDISKALTKDTRY